MQEHLLNLVLFASITAITPGASNIAVAASGLAFGLKRSLPFIIGLLAGFSFLLFTSAVGLSKFLSQYPRFDWWLKLTGTAYFVWLAWQFAKLDTLGLNFSGKQKPLSFIQGVCFPWFNPKAWAMALGASASYAELSPQPLVFALLIVTVFFITVAISFYIWCMFGVWIARFLTSRRNLTIFRVLFSSALLSCVIFLWL